MAKKTTPRGKTNSRATQNDKVESEPQLIIITPDNINDEHLCCALGDPKHEEGVARKKAWLKKQMKHGLTFRKFDVRGKVFIEYTPAEHAWRPIVAPGFLFIHCLWVSGRFQGHGYGKRLLNACIEDARAQKKAGVCVVTTKKKTSFVTNKTFFEKFGFESVDTAPPNFELLALRLKKSAKPPEFHPNAKAETAKGAREAGSKVRLVFTDQCPFTTYWPQHLAQHGEHEGFDVELKRLTSERAAQTASSAYASFSIEWNGERISHSIPGPKEFTKRLAKLQA